MHHPRPPAPATAVSAAEIDQPVYPQLNLVRGLAGRMSLQAVVVLLCVAAASALFASSSTSSSSSAASPSSAGRTSSFFHRPHQEEHQQQEERAALLASVNAPYYQARLRQIALELGPRHPIRAARAPHALFADVRLSPLFFSPLGGGGGGSQRGEDARARGLAMLLAASDGGDPRGVPTDVGAYELFEPAEAGGGGGGGGAGGEPPPPPRPPQRARQPQQRRRLTCLAAAQRLFPEPFHPSMLARNRTVPTSWAAEAASAAAAAKGPAAATDDPRPPWRQAAHPHPTKLPPALWRWDAGAISRADYDALPTFLGGKDCRMCYDVVRYKLWRGRLYRRSSDCARDLRNASAPRLPPGATRCGADWPRGRWLEEILLVAAYLYALPDGDLAVHRGDGAAAGVPVLQHNIPRDDPRGGFALPYPEHWVQGGPPSARQAAAWAACTRARYGRLASPRRAAAREGEGAAGGASSAKHEGPGAVGGSNSNNNNNKNNNSESSGDSNDDGASCARAPLIPKAVWRGATNDAARGAWLHEVLGMARARLHVLSLVHADALDARVAAVSQMDEPRGFAPMAADRLADERLFGVPPTPLDGDGWPVAKYGYGKGAVRAAQGRLADCRGENGGGGGGGGKEEEEGGDGLRAGAAGAGAGSEASGGDERATPLPSPAPPTPLYMLMEDYNRYAAVLDVDGNGWSARLWALLLGASARPVLKQATPLAGPYEHLFAPGRHIAHFRGDLRDVDDVARRFVGSLGPGGAEVGRGEEGAERSAGASSSSSLFAGPRRRQRQQQQQQQQQQQRSSSCPAPMATADTEEDAGLPTSPRGADAMASEASALAALALNRWALVESAAAAMEAYAERTDWAASAPSEEGGWDLVPFSGCCVHGGMPVELVAAMRGGGD